VQFESLEFIQL